MLAVPSPLEGMAKSKAKGRIEVVGGEVLGREAVRRRAASPDTVIELARSLVETLRAYPATDLEHAEAVAQYVRLFQEAFGQGLRADGVYTPQTRQALSSILDVLPRDLPAPRRYRPTWEGAPAAPAPAPAPVAAPVAEAPPAPAPPPPPPGGGPPPVATLEPHPPAPVMPPPPLPPGPSPVAAPAPTPAAGPVAAAPPAGPITREAAARAVSIPLEECLMLVNVLSAALPLAHDAGRGTAAALAPSFERISALLREAGAEPVLASRNLNLFDVSIPPVALMGIEVSGGLAEDAAALLADARALATRQRDAVLAYAIAYPVGLISRLREAFADLRQRVAETISRLGTLSVGAAQRLSNFCVAWLRQFDASFSNFASGVGGIAVGGTGLLLALALVLYLVLRRR